MPPITMLIKPASGLCNLACKYCFYDDVASHRETRNYGLMSLETAEVIVRRAFEVAEGFCTFAFQGGEPTLCGLEFFRAFCRLAEQNNANHIIIQWSIQTNGMVIDDKWAEFFREKGFLVGLSLDGSAELHNSVRTSRDGKGSYTRVLRTAEVLKKHKVDFNILCVVTNRAARSGKKLYEFFKKNGFSHLQFIPCLAPIDADSDYALTPERYALFLNTIFDAWYDDIAQGRYISVRHLDNYIWVLAGARAEACPMQGRCTCQYVIEADGGVYPCDFYVTDEWYLGNVVDLGLEDLYQAKRAQNFMKSSVARPACDGCQWFQLCRGGCRRDFVTSGSAHQNRFCESYKAFFEHCYPRMLEISRGQPQCNSTGA